MIYRRGGAINRSASRCGRKRFTAALPMGCGASHRQLLSRQVPWPTLSMSRQCSPFRNSSTHNAQAEHIYLFSFMFLLIGWRCPFGNKSSPWCNRAGWNDRDSIVVSVLKRFVLIHSHSTHAEHVFCFVFFFSYYRWVPLTLRLVVIATRLRCWWRRSRPFRGKPKPTRRPSERDSKRWSLWIYMYIYHISYIYMCIYIYIRIRVGLTP